MKKILMLLALLLVPSLSLADVVLIDEEFRDQTLNPRWTQTGTVDTTTGGQAKFAGGVAIRTTVDSRGFTALKLEIVAKTEGLASPSYGVAEWSSDGGTIWNQILQLTDIADFTVFTATLPQGALARSSLLFRVRNTGTLSSEKLFLRSIILNGEGEATGVVPLFQDDFAGQSLGSHWLNPNNVKSPTGFAKLAASDSIQTTISTTGFKNLLFSYVRKTRKLTGSLFGTAQWSTDGGATWNLIETTQIEDFAALDVPFGAGADNQASLLLRFSLNGTKGSEEYLIDRIVVTGEAITGPPPQTFEPASYKYNARGQRVLKEVAGDPNSPIHFTYDQDGQLLAEIAATGQTIREYIYVNGENVAFVNQPGTPQEETVYVGNDHLETPRVVTDQAKQIVWDADYKPFGESSILAEVVKNPNRFPGQYKDDESGYYYNYFRDYDPTIGRYIESDPIGLDGGLNTYGYVDQNPVRNSDPEGLGPAKAVFKIIKLCKDGFKVQRKVTFDEAAKLAKKGNVDILAPSRKQGKKLGKRVSPGTKPIEELPHKPGYMPHFHPNPRNGTHIFFQIAGGLTLTSLATCEDCTQATILEILDYFNPLSTPQDIIETFQ